MLTAARAISAGSVPWPSGTDAAWRSNWAWLWRELGRAGPGPIALTRIAGANASAIVWVNAHRPALESV